MKTCENCGKECPKQNGKFCSMDCYWNWHRKTFVRKYVKKTCGFCKKEFDFPEHRTKYGDNYGNYCSIQCKNIGNKQPRVKREERICKRCGKTFLELPSQLKRENGAGTYCSRKCQYPPVFNTCEVCGKEFRISPSSPDVCCSKKCSNASKTRGDNISKAQKKLHKENPEFRGRFLDWIKRRTASENWRNSAHFQKGEDHPAYKGNASARENAMGHYDYKKWRTDVFKRDDYTCQRCGKRGWKLHAHHIKEWAECPDFRYEVNNGLTLCEPCHAKEHGKEYRPKHYKCVICGVEKTDGKSPRCRSCGAKRIPLP